MSQDVTITPYAEEQLLPLFELFSSYFSTDDRLLTPAYSRWLYAGNPFGLARMVRVEEGGRWVAFMGMIPVELANRDERLRSWYVVNVLVHPQFHGKHLFGRMIKSAMALVDAEGSALMGHPNDMALKSWKRAQMHFHEPLRPGLAWPVCWLDGLKARRVEVSAPLKVLASMLTGIVAQSDGLRVAVTPEYLDWRYLRHPANAYVMQLLQHGGEAVGVQVSKRLKPGTHLLIDQFVLPEHRAAATRHLPRLTLCFWPESVFVGRQGMAIPLPLKKRIPVFLTHTGQPVDGPGVTEIGLSASDF